MQYPPKGYKPGGFSAHNGRPTYSDDPKEIDHYSTYLAAAYRPELPAIVADATWASSGSFEYMVRFSVPPYTANIAVAFLTVGQGTITLECSDDSYTAASGTLMIPYATGVFPPAAESVISSAQWVYFSEPFVGVASNGQLRAIDVTPDASSRSVNVHWTIAHTGSGQPLGVLAVKAWLLPVDDTAILTS